MKNDDYQKLVRDASLEPKKYPKLASTIEAAKTELEKRNKDFESLRKDTQELVDYHRERSGFNKATKGGGEGTETAAASDTTPKVERPSWVPPRAKLSEDGNWYIQGVGGKYKKVVKNED
jgi:hypothetical protein